MSTLRSDEIRCGSLSTGYLPSSSSSSGSAAAFFPLPLVFAWGALLFAFLFLLSDRPIIRQLVEPQKRSSPAGSFCTVAADSAAAGGAAGSIVAPLVAMGA